MINSHMAQIKCTAQKNVRLLPTLVIKDEFMEKIFFGCALKIIYMMVREKDIPGGGKYQLHAHSGWSIITRYILGLGILLFISMFLSTVNI